MVGIRLLAENQASFWLPERGTPGAAEVDSVLSFVFWISAFFFALIVGLMVLFLVRYRRPKGERPEPSPHSHLGIELVWTAIPIVVVFAIFWAGFRTFMDMVVPPEDALQIQVVGQKWQWTFEYPNGLVTDSLHVPVDRDVELVIRSEDVIHSFWVPAFRIKMDAVPGRYNKMWFHADRPGEYPAVCAEYCGTLHGDMRTTVVVHERGGYEEWLKRAADIFSPFLRPSAVIDLEVFLLAMQEGERPIDVYVRGRLSEEVLVAIRAHNLLDEPSEELVAIVLDALNDIIDGDTIWDPERFEGVAIGDDTRELIETEAPTEEQVNQGNRLLLADAYPKAFRRGPDPVSAGLSVFQGMGCAGCHSTTTAGGIGPGLGELFGKSVRLANGQTVVADENYIHESIIDPMAKIVAGYEPKMPSMKGRLSDRQLSALVQYIRSLSAAGAEEGDEEEAGNEADDNEEVK